MQEIARQSREEPPPIAIAHNYTTIRLAGGVGHIIMPLIFGWQVALGFYRRQLLLAGRLIGMKRLGERQCAHRGGRRGRGWRRGSRSHSGPARSPASVAGLGLLGVAEYYAFLRRRAALDINNEGKPASSPMRSSHGSAPPSSQFCPSRRGILHQGRRRRRRHGGQSEAGSPRTSRNPATIADNVGENVGDCAAFRETSSRPSRSPP